MDNRDKIFSIIDDFRTQDSTEEERQKYVDAAYLLMEQQGIQLIKKK